MNDRSIECPGWPEMIVGTIALVLAMLAGGLVMISVPESLPVTQGVAAFLVSGGVGMAGFFAAMALRIRSMPPFGFRRVGARWLAAGVGLAVVTYVVNTGLVLGYERIFGVDDTQASYHAAAQGGVTALLVTLCAGAIVTPLGEEMFFRGVIANALGRYGAWAGIGLSAMIFAVSHGTNVVLLNALVAGLLTGWLFHKTRSIWPGFVLHAVYNAAGIVTYSLM